MIVSSFQLRSSVAKWEATPSKPPQCKETTTNQIMKTLISLTCLTLVACSPGGGYHSRTRAKAAPTKNIAELAIATPQLSTLLAAVKAAGLVDTLAGEGPFTVFAPTNDAFAKIPEETLNGLLADKDALTAVLLRHVVPGAALKARDVPKGTTTVKTAGGEEIDVTRGRYITVKSSAGEAGVIAFDVLATNGVVHLVNSVF